MLYQKSHKILFSFLLQNEEHFPLQSGRNLMVFWNTVAACSKLFRSSSDNTRADVLPLPARSQL